MLARPGQGVGQDQPALRIGVAHLHGQALAGGQDVPRAHGVAGDGVLHRRDQQHQANLQPRIHDHPRQGQAVGRAAHVLLHQPHARGRLDVQPAGVEHHALAHQRHHRMGFIAPGQFDQTWRAGWHGGAAHGVDGGIVGGQQVVADGDLDLGAVFPGDLAGDGLDLQRAHVVGRRVDHVARHRAGVADPHRLGPVGVGSHHQARAVAPGAGLVAVEHIVAERPGQGDLGAVHARGHGGEAVVAGRQLGRQGRGTASDRAGPPRRAPAPPARSCPRRSWRRTSVPAEALNSASWAWAFTPRAAAAEEGVQVALAHRMDGNGFALRCADQDIGHGRTFTG